MSGNLILEQFAARASELGEQSAFTYRRPRDQKWVSMSWQSYEDQVYAVARWLAREADIKKGDRVAILSKNRPEWIICQLAIWRVGGICVPIDPAASQQTSAHMFKHAACKLLICDEPTDEHIFSMSEKVLSFEQPAKAVSKATAQRCVLFTAAVNQADGGLEDLMSVEQDENDLALILYTSSESGKPKGVMHSHGNLAQASLVLRSYLKREDNESDRMLSFLPLAHVAEQSLIILGSISVGAEVAFARSVQTLTEDMQRLKPSVLLCVPRLWEKMSEKVRANLLVAPLWKQAIFAIGRQLGELSFVAGGQTIRKQAFASGRLASASFSILSDATEALVGKKLKRRLGLDHCRVLFTGSAPIRSETLKFFGSFGILIREVYGLTENLGLGFIHEPSKVVVGSCGLPFEGTTLRIAEDGEIYLKSAWMFKGYLEQPTETRQAFTKDGWFKTGDLGSLDDTGLLWINGRKKELLKTSGGKFVAPVPLEKRLKSHVLINDAVVIGDMKKYCVAMISIDGTVAQDTAQIKVELKKILKRLNQSLASFETIKRIGVVSEQVLPKSSPLSSSEKRERIYHEYADLIDKIYHSEDEVVFNLTRR